MNTSLTPTPFREPTEEERELATELALLFWTELWEGRNLNRLSDSHIALITLFSRWMVRNKELLK